MFAAGNLLDGRSHFFFGNDNARSVNGLGAIDSVFLGIKIIRFLEYKINLFFEIDSPFQELFSVLHFVLGGRSQNLGAIQGDRTDSDEADVHTGGKNLFKQRFEISELVFSEIWILSAGKPHKNNIFILA